MSPVRTDLNGARLLAKLRVEAKLTQGELATRAKVSRSMIAQLEIGERRPSRKLIHNLCHAMQLSEKDEQQLLLAYNFSPSGETPEQIAAFLRADKNLTPDQKESLMKIIREMYEKYRGE